MIRKLLVTLPILVLSVAACSGNTDENQRDLREGTVKIDSATYSDLTEIPEFIKLDANRIILNGDNWDILSKKLAAAYVKPVNFLQIGDSHIQADVSSHRVRTLLQNKYGNGGRGLITPLKIAGTNEPFNYIFTTDDSYTSAKLLKLPWMTDMGFTGVSFSPNSNSFAITLSTEVKSCPEGDPFNFINLYSDGRIFIDKIENGVGERVVFSDSVSDYETSIRLKTEQTAVTLHAHTFETVTIFGASLLNKQSGIRYHAIGNNGATYSTYNQLMSMGSDISMLEPDLVIISLGTNEAFGTVSDAELYSEISYMVQDIKKHNPGVKILLTTPMECQRAKRVAARKSRKGRRRTVYSKTYSVNSNVKRMRNVILKYGKDKGIPVYDWYEIAGGDGASDKWIENKLMNTDRVHNTFAGYELQGQLLFNALESTFGTESND